MDETFQGKIRQAVNSGNKPAEQIRNKFTRRFLYSLPSTDKGKIIDSQEMFELEVTKAMLKNSDQRIVLHVNYGRGDNPTKKVTFPNFVLSTKFPDNVFILKNNTVVVCLNIVEEEDTNVMRIICATFDKVEKAFDDPYDSAEYHSYLVSKCSNQRFEEFNVNSIKAKMLALPYLPEVTTTLPDILKSVNDKWFVTALQHTVL
jgi:hypothetical protein